MAGGNGSAYPDIATKPPLPADAHNCNFHALMEALYRRYGAPDQGISLRTGSAREVVRFNSDTSISFPGTDLSALPRSQNGRYVLQTRLLGFSGSQSPLSGYYLGQVVQESAQNENGLKEFLDLLSHRWTQFAYRVWHKYHCYICFYSDDTGTFSQRMYILVELGSQNVRNKLVINHNKMLIYAGVLATSDRAPEIICNLVSHCFDLPNITIERWQLRKVAIDPVYQNRLGVHSPKRRAAGHIPGRSVLGVNFTLGARVPDRSGKFLLQTGGLLRERYLSFLPGGENRLPLTMSLSFILRNQFAWDLQLCLTPQQAKEIHLNDLASSRLGRTSFIG